MLIRKIAYKVKNIENYVSEKDKENLDKILNLEQVNLENEEAAYFNRFIIIPFSESVNDNVYLEVNTPKKQTIDYTDKLPNEETRNFMKTLQKESKIRQKEMSKIINVATKSLKNEESIEKQIEIIKETTEKVINQKQIDDYIKCIHQNCDRLINCLFLDNFQLFKEDEKKEVLHKIKVLESQLQDLKEQIM